MLETIRNGIKRVVTFLKGESDPIVVQDELESLVSEIPLGPLSAPAIEVENRGLITVMIMLATIMQVLDTTIANVALPDMQGSLSATQDQVSWVLTSYIVAAAIMKPTWLIVDQASRRLRSYCASATQAPPRAVSTASVSSSSRASGATAKSGCIRTTR